MFSMCASPNIVVLVNEWVHGTLLHSLLLSSSPFNIQILRNIQYVQPLLVKMSETSRIRFDEAKCTLHKLISTFEKL